MWIGLLLINDNFNIVSYDSGPIPINIGPVLFLTGLDPPT